MMRKMNKMKLSAVLMTILFLTSVMSIAIPLSFADSISGPGGVATYHPGLDLRDGSTWVVTLKNIDYSGLTDYLSSGKEAFQFVVHEWDGALSDWAIIGIQVHKESGASAFQLFYATGSVSGGAYQVVSTHGIPDLAHPTWPFATTFDMKLDLRYESGKFVVFPYFRLPGETN